MEKYFGFRLSDLSSLSSLARLLHRPCDPSSLALARIMYGILIIMDLPEERGFSEADWKWGNPLECRFPLFDFLSPLPVEWMYMVYLLMLTGALGITLGAFYKISCSFFLISYWYIFFLDKTSWNNHSYLFGWLGFILLCTDANRCWSVDGWWKKSIKHTHVPLWNYTLLRGQVFLVYFMAGLKKLDKDWIGGYSMQYLSTHWIFDIFKYVITEDQIDQYIVHWGGFLLDFTVGFLLFFNETRPIGILFCVSFNAMNSQLFHIGMFPYMMIAITPIFCNHDWPKALMRSVPDRIKKRFLQFQRPNINSNCVYDSKSVNPAAKTVKLRHKLVTVGICAYFALHSFLPYSHSLTKGYNTWTHGLYGYSWDMMIHNWETIRKKITVIDKTTDEEFYINPESWADGTRWLRHADMVKQFAKCIQQRMHDIYNISAIELYFDVWMSLNGRFAQRVFDPTINIIEADWSPFREVTWVLPLLTELSEWRTKMLETELLVTSESDYADVLFLADFPGYYLLNYVDEDMGDTKFRVLKGTVLLEFVDGEEKLIMEDDVIQIHVGMFHKVIPLKYQPVCYMYIYTNTTRMKLDQEWKQSMINPNKSHGYSQSGDNFDVRKEEYFRMKTESMNQVAPTTLETYQDLLHDKYHLWKRSLSMLGSSLYSIFIDSSAFEDHLHDLFLNE